MTQSLSWVPGAVNRITMEFSGVQYPRINKLFDLQDFNKVATAAIVERLLKTKHVLDQTGLPYYDFMQDHCLKLWECAAAVIDSRLDKRMTVLDAGGTAAVFPYYMALEGCVVHTVDLLQDKIEQAKKMSEALGLQMYDSVQDIAELNYPDCSFDAVYCICVIEHISTPNQPVALKQLSRVLKPGGILVVTFDYGKDASDYPIVGIEEVYSRIAAPTGLEIIGNQDFHAVTNDLCGTTLDYTFGSLFLKKPGQLSFSNDPDVPVGTPRLLDISQEEGGFSAEYYRPR